MWDLQENVPDMVGKTIVITGCTSGVGLESASQLLERNATIVMACRNKAKMKVVAQSLREKHHIPSPSPSPSEPSEKNRIYELELDVSDLQSVRAFPVLLQQAGVQQLHALVLNAGVVREDYGYSPQGVELTFATNILGHWLLTKLLLPLLQQVEASRIIAVSSLTHYTRRSLDYDTIRAAVDRTDKDDLSSVFQSYAGRSMYAQSKLAMYWLVHELNRQLTQANAKTVAVVAHPGYATTNMTLPSSPTNAEWLSARLVHFVASPFRQSGEQGAWPLTMAASDTAVSPHLHYGPGTLGLWGIPSRLSLSPSPFAFNEAEECRLWEFCESLCQQ